MAFYLRKVKRNHWIKDNEVCAVHAADAITDSLHTYSNGLSIWLSESSANVDHAVLAMLLSHEDTSTFDVVCISSEFLEGSEIEYEQIDAKNENEYLRVKHHDMLRLNIDMLILVADHVKGCCQQYLDQKIVNRGKSISSADESLFLIKRFNKSKILDLVESAIQKNEVKPEHFREQFFEKYSQDISRREQVKANNLAN
ncbi:MAG: hypothetical protein JKY86_02030 [Gammaproteobacteria bacterium]|nr:hypothetical protein [Gammaproteobacteria bacterium]